MELKDKLINYQDDEPVYFEDFIFKNTQAVEDAKSVLLSLGYEKEEIKSAISKAIALVNENATAEDVLKETLKILSV